MVSRPTLQKHGGRALGLLTIALKTDSNKPMNREFCKSQKYWTTGKSFCIIINALALSLKSFMYVDAPDYKDMTARFGF